MLEARVNTSLEDYLDINFTNLKFLIYILRMYMLRLSHLRESRWNKIRHRIFNVVQRWYNVGVRRWNNVESTLHNVVSILSQRWYGIISMLFQCGLNVSGSYIKTNLASEKYRFAERFVSFILLNEKIFFTIY